MSKPSCTNSPTSSSVGIPLPSERMKSFRESKRDDEEQAARTVDTTDGLEVNLVIFSQDIYCGGYSGEDPPLPIPNREVKLTIADGTAPPGGRVGSCHFLIRVPDINRCRGLLHYAGA